MSFLIINFVRCTDTKCGDLRHCAGGECVCIDGFVERDHVCKEICADETCKDMDIYFTILSISVESQSMCHSIPFLI